jgi:hydrogenase maturation protein HypF
VLACGALLKNTFCLGADGTAFLGPHIGDLENLETFDAYEHAIARMERFIGVAPEIVVHDLHPDYLSTRYGQRRGAPVTIAVQHHHAHVAAAMAEHGLDGPVIGVAYDGTGLGTDGEAWGGEILIAGYTRFMRVATFRAIALPGGDIAVRQVWRQALALVDDAFDGGAPLDRLALFRDVPPGDLAVVRAMLSGRVNCPRAHGVGRYFDAVGALALARTEARYEGQVALEWNLAADPDEDGKYGFDISGGPGPLELDLRPAVRALAGDVLAGVAAAIVSARFHNTLAAATIALVERARRRAGDLPVVLTGGVFQNALLVERLIREAGPQARLFRHAAVPPGDGGLALGQAVVADALVRAGRAEAVEDVCA